MKKISDEVKEFITKFDLVGENGENDINDISGFVSLESLFNDFLPEKIKDYFNDLDLETFALVGEFATEAEYWENLENEIMVHGTLVEEFNDNIKLFTHPVIGVLIGIDYDNPGYIIVAK